MKNKNLEWFDVIDAMYGVRLNDKQLEIWEHFLKPRGVKNEELCLIITEASRRKLKTRNYRATVADLIDWVKMSRNNWQPESKWAHIPVVDPSDPHGLKGKKA